MSLVGLVIVGALVYVIVCAVQIATNSGLAAAPTSVGPVQAIVVMGAPAAGTQPSSDMLGRLRQGLLLYKSHRAPGIVVTGSLGPAGEPSTTSIESSWLRQNGVPKTSIEIVQASGVTQSLFQASALIGSGTRTIIVTDAVDALYDKAAATSLGLNTQISPAVGSKKAFFTELEALFREASALAAGRVVGYARISWAMG
jgi:uncharacterized SAM-binding protein YcdF (DUF218 family)